MSAHAEEHFAGSNKLFTSIWVWLVLADPGGDLSCLQADADPFHVDDPARPFNHQGRADRGLLHALEV